MRRALWKTRRDGRRNIAVVGFMGTGKSVVAERVAAITGMSLVDIDKRIEEKARATIAEIFRTDGEDEFRRMEQAEIEEVGLDVERDRGVRRRCLDEPVERPRPEEQLPLGLALGGRKIALERIGDKLRDPCSEAGEDTESVAQALLAQRLPSYARTSDLLIDTSRKNPTRSHGGYGMNSVAPSAIEGVLPAPPFKEHARAGRRSRPPGGTVSLEKVRHLSCDDGVAAAA